MITSLKEDGDTLLFNISNINVSYVNGIRRTITSDIPCAIFKNSHMTKATASLPKIQPDLIMKY